MISAELFKPDGKAAGTGKKIYYFQYLGDITPLNYYICVKYFCPVCEAHHDRYYTK